MVLWLPVSMAILSLVPTPSLAATSTRIDEPGRLEVEQAAKAADLGIGAGPAGSSARRGLMASTSAFPASMSTPACL